MPQLLLRNLLIFAGLLLFSMMGCSSVRPVVQQAGENRYIIVRLAEDNSIGLIWIPDLAMWFGETEVSIKQFCVYNKRMIPLNYLRGWPGYNEEWPAVNVSADYGRAFCDWLTNKANLNKFEGYVFRLPSSEEWEVAARCSGDKIYPWGNEWPPQPMADGMLPNLAGDDAINQKEKLPVPFPDKQRFTIRDYHDGWQSICPVFKSGRNKWGIYGLAGNAEEWCYPKTVERINEKWVLKGGSYGSFLAKDLGIAKDEVLPMKQWPFFPLLKDQPSTYRTGFRIVLAKPLKLEPGEDGNE